MKDYRPLSLEKLRRYRACSGAIIEFINLFFSVNDVLLNEYRIRGMDEALFERTGRLINGHSRVLSREGRRLFERAARNRGVLYPENDLRKRREHLALMARYYVRYPRRMPRK